VEYIALDLTVSAVKARVHRARLLLRRRLRAEQEAAVGDELRAGREAGLVGGDEQH
jgi:hypothetical protein